MIDVLALAALLLAMPGALTSCHRASMSAPTVHFLHVPAAEDSSPNVVAEISGRVTGFSPGQRVVVYAHTDVWWVQPSEANAYTTIDTDGRWSASTRFGKEYAALVVDPTFRAPAAIPALPSPGHGVLSVSSAPGSAETITPKATKTLRFAGYDWEARALPGDRGGIMREYDPANVFVDPTGAMHLRITHHNDRWVCSEIALTRSLGHGTYLFEVRDVSKLQPAADLAMFTWSTVATGQDHVEVDINIGQRGDPFTKNAEYVVQPYYMAPNVFRFIAPKGLLTYSFDWEPHSVAFTTFPGHAAAHPAKPLASHTFTSSIPAPNEETVHMNFCVYEFSKVPMQREDEVVLENFQYLP